MTWVGQCAPLLQYSACGEARWSDVISSQNVKHDFVRGDQIVCDDPAMTPPPHGLGAHHYTCRCMSQLAQPCYTESKFVACGVICIIMKALILPEGIHCRRQSTLPSAEAS